MKCSECGYKIIEVAQLFGLFGDEGVNDEPRIRIQEICPLCGEIMYPDDKTVDAIMKDKLGIQV